MILNYIPVFQTEFMNFVSRRITPTSAKKFFNRFSNRSFSRCLNKAHSKTLVSNSQNSNLLRKTLHFDFHSSNSTFLLNRYLSVRSRSWLRKSSRGNYEIVELAEVGPSRVVPDYIEKPDYAVTGVAEEPDSGIEIQSPEQINHMRKSCALAKRVLDEVASKIEVGVTTDMLDAVAHAACVSLGVYPSPLNYRGFPKSICTSVNNIACHGIPDNRALKDGDIISVDVSVYHNGFHGDCAATYSVGNVDARGRKLLTISLLCLDEAIKICRPGQTFNVIGKTISEIAKKNKYCVVPAFCGHGIGSYFHGPPNVLHYENDDDRVIKKGMIFTIEPVICEGRPDIVVLEDGWTATTEDNTRCAQFEHTLLITERSAEVLTVSNALNQDIDC